MRSYVGASGSIVDCSSFYLPRQVTKEDLAAIEVVGGGVRPRCVKRTIAQCLNMKIDDATNHELSTTLNMDECVARGCALACAMVSPLVRMKDFKIMDLPSYPIRVSWGSNPTAKGTGDKKEEESLVLVTPTTELPTNKRLRIPVRAGTVRT